MNKCILGFVFSVFICLFGFSTHCAELLPAEEVYKNVMSAFMKIDSYKLTNYRKGHDYSSQETKDNLSSQAKVIGKSFYKGVEEEEGHPIMEGTYELKFKKPYLLQMKLIKSDYTPSIAYGTIVTYRPDKTPENWWAKPKFLPFAIKRSVEKDDAGGFFQMGWTFNLIEMEYFKNVASALSVKGLEKFQGKDCYILEFVFSDALVDQKEPKKGKDGYKVNLKLWGIPLELKKIAEAHMNDLMKKNITKYIYLIEKEQFIILKAEEYVDGKFRQLSEYKDIELNTLSEKDF